MKLSLGLAIFSIALTSSGVNGQTVCLSQAVDCCGSNVDLIVDVGAGGCCTGSSCVLPGDCTSCVTDFANDCAETCRREIKKDFCFSSSNTVEVQDQGLISINSLKIGDYVRAGKNKFSRVYSFLHLDHEAEADFLQIQAEGLETPLEISAEHMVFVKDTPVRASQVKVGDMLGENKVSEINTVKRRGVYTPVTESGDIVVSGALASSYAAVHNYTPINQHTEAHAFFSLRRLVCAFNFEICKSETYTADGFPQWLSPMIHFTLSTKQNPFAQFFASVVGLPFIAAAYMLEQMVLCPFLVGAIMVGLYAFKKTKASKVKIQ